MEKKKTHPKFKGKPVWCVELTNSLRCKMTEWKTKVGGRGGVERKVTQGATWKRAE